MSSGLVYLVTGGCGFLGERVVDLLLNQKYITEIRVLDKTATEDVKKLWKDLSKVNIIYADITDFNQLLKAMNGVHVVIHSAAIVDYVDLTPEGQMEEVNVGGTRNVLKACSVLNIQYLVYTSSIAALGPNTKGEPLKRGTEESLYTGELLLNYGKTKAIAEKLVLGANGTQLPSGEHFYSCVIRPAGIYGEKHKDTLTVYRNAKAKNGVMNFICPLDSEMVYAYVGNVAWMHVLAAKELQAKPEKLGGQLYFAYDDTPLKSITMFHYELFSKMDPSIKLGKQIPYWVIWMIVFLYTLFKTLLRPFWNLKPFLTFPALQFIVTTFSYKTDKAFRHFEYQPLYSWEESRRKTCKWMQTVVNQASNHESDSNLFP
ncbi:3 beta-hydroxysteroid dehydrogenase type 7-like [Protopterus annectens]|uniref:3 beta-hydroxysteroid dehydrogenase type 7-like n=1 Tax=Protopterus annectens TaxID=7888 RepID=UPI001CFB4B7E|nr:3 beta-hydroxysteroid dehydrogenase type 7-like [Protopterus annectens]